jgi:hypothetical protein
MIILLDETVAARVSVGDLSTTPRHPDALVLRALATDTARNVGGIRSMLEVASTGRHQGGLKLL